MADPCIDDVPIEECKAPWNAKKWSATLEGHKQDAIKNGRPLWRDDNMSRDRLLAGATTKYMTDGNPITVEEDDGTFTEIPPPDMSVCVCKFFKKEYAPTEGVKRAFPGTRVRIVNADVIEFVHRLTLRYKDAGIVAKVVALNMANQFTPGGGFIRGRVAQEEALCYSTGLHHCLDPKEYEGPNGIGEFTASLLLNVPVLRKGLNDGFAFLKPSERWDMNIVSLAGYDRHKLPKEEQRAPLSPEHYAGVHTKVNSILCAAASAGARTVVLGALGCGAFANPPDQISEIFSHVIHRFAGVFENIYFAIMADPSDFKLAAFQKNLVGKPVDDPKAYFEPGLSKEEDEEKGAFYEAPKDMDLPSGPILKPCPLMCECEDHSEEHRAAFEHHPFHPFHPKPSE